MANRRSRGNARTPSFYSLFNPFQILRDVFFREAQRSTCAITGQPLTSNLTHHCRAGDAATKLPDILNGVLRSLALQRRASLHLLRLLFHSSLACKYDFVSYLRIGQGARWTSSTGCVAPTVPVSVGPAIYISPISVVSRKAYLGQPSLGEPLAKTCRQMTTLFTVQNRHMTTTASPTDVKCRPPRDELSSAVRSSQ